MKNVDIKIVTSVVVGMAAFGGLVYAAKMSGIGPVTKAANIVK